MKYLKNLLIIILLGIVMLPISLFAKEKEYKTLNFKETLKDEEIAPVFSNYEENDDQITIYMFRGKGCGYCRKYLEFMNSITEEYGKYFKMVSFETWYDQNNATYLDEISKFLNEPAGGVPYIIIGEKVFAGYAESYDAEIKEAITTLYNTPKEERYDVIAKYNEGNKKDSSENNGDSKTGIIIFNIILTVILFGALAIYVGKKRADLEDRIIELEETIEKIEKKANKTAKKDK